MVIFADTFSNNFEPGLLHAARRVLQAAGHRVAVAWPTLGAPALCCGRTYLATGQVEKAKAEARRLLQALMPFVARGVPIVGLEPSCLFTLRDEFLAMGLGEEAKAVGENAFLFEEFLVREKKAGRLALELKPLPHKTALLHGHCHQKAFGAMSAVQEALSLVPELAVSVIDFELLRHGRQLRLRGRALRDLDRHGRAVAAARRAQGRSRGADRGRRHLVPPPDRRRQPTDRRYTSPRCWRGRSSNLRLYLGHNYSLCAYQISVIPSGAKRSRGTSFRGGDMRQPVVYILSSATGRALYIGITTDLARRLGEHRAGKVAHTSKYRINRLIFVEWHDTAPDAIAREKQLKGWRRSKKIALVNHSNPDWRDLSGEIDA